MRDTTFGSLALGVERKTPQSAENTSPTFFEGDHPECVSFRADLASFMPGRYTRILHRTIPTGQIDRPKGGSIPAVVATRACGLAEPTAPALCTRLGDSPDCTLELD